MSQTPQPQTIRVQHSETPIVLVVDGIQARVSVVSKPMTREELANYYSVDPTTIDNWRRKRIIPYTKIRGVLRFSLHEVETALQPFKSKTKKRIQASIEKILLEDDTCSESRPPEVSKP